MVRPDSETEILRSLALLIALIATHDLTHYLLYPAQRRKLYWAARGIVLGGNGLTPMGTLFLAVLVIFTHSAYDFVRKFFERLFQRQEHQMRQELRRLGQDRSSDTALLHYLRRGLAILCHNLNAPYGLIALRNGNRYEVIVSLQSLPVGSKFSGVEIALKEDVQPTGILKGNSFWFVRSQAGQEEVAVIGIGQRKSKAPLSEEDFYWLEVIAEEIGWMIFSHRRNRLEAAAATAEPFVKEASEPDDFLEGEELFSRLAYKPDPDLVTSIEEGFRNLNDYSKLGNLRWRPCWESRPRTILNAVSRSNTN